MQMEWKPIILFNNLLSKQNSQIYATSEINDKPTFYIEEIVKSEALSNDSTNTNNPTVKDAQSDGKNIAKFQGSNEIIQQKQIKCRHHLKHDLASVRQLGNTAEKANGQIVLQNYSIEFSQLLPSDKITITDYNFPLPQTETNELTIKEKNAKTPAKSKGASRKVLKVSKTLNTYCENPVRKIRNYDQISVRQYITKQREKRRLKDQLEKLMKQNKAADREKSLRALQLLQKKLAPVKLNSEMKIGSNPNLSSSLVDSTNTYSSINDQLKSKQLLQVLSKKFKINEQMRNMAGMFEESINRMCGTKKLSMMTERHMIFDFDDTHSQVQEEKLNKILILAKSLQELVDEEIVYLKNNLVEPKAFNRLDSDIEKDHVKECGKDIEFIHLRGDIAEELFNNFEVNDDFGFSFSDTLRKIALNTVIGKFELDTTVKLSADGWIQVPLSEVPDSQSFVNLWISKYASEKLSEIGDINVQLSTTSKVQLKHDIVVNNETHSKFENALIDKVMTPSISATSKEMELLSIKSLNTSYETQDDYYGSISEGPLILSDDYKIYQISAHIERNKMSTPLNENDTLISHQSLLSKEDVTSMPKNPSSLSKLLYDNSEREVSLNNEISSKNKIIAQMSPDTLQLRLNTELVYLDRVQEFIDQLKNFESSRAITSNQNETAALVRYNKELNTGTPISNIEVTQVDSDNVTAELNKPPIRNRFIHFRESNKMNAASVATRSSSAVVVALSNLKDKLQNSRKRRKYSLAQRSLTDDNFDCSSIFERQVNVDCDVDVDEIIRDGSGNKLQYPVRGSSLKKKCFKELVKKKMMILDYKENHKTKRHHLDSTHAIYSDDVNLKKDFGDASYYDFTSTKVKQNMTKEQRKHQQANFKFRNGALLEKAKADFGMIKLKKQLSLRNDHQIMTLAKKEQNQRLDKLKLEKKDSKSHREQKKISRCEDLSLTKQEKAVSKLFISNEELKTKQNIDEINEGVKNSDLQSCSHLKLVKSAIINDNEVVNKCRRNVVKKPIKLHLSKQLLAAHEKSIIHRRQNIEMFIERLRKLVREEAQLEKMENEVFQMINEKNKDNSQIKFNLEKIDASMNLLCNNLDSVATESSTVIKHLSSTSAFIEALSETKPNADAGSIAAATLNHSLEKELIKTRQILLREPLAPTRTHNIIKRRKDSSGSEDSGPVSFSETTSEISDIEGRIFALKEDLRLRRKQAEWLRKEQKRKTEGRLKSQEISLIKQIEAYDRFINQTKIDLQNELQDAWKVVVKPLIKTPKVAETRRHHRHLQFDKMNIYTAKIEEISPLVEYCEAIVDAAANGNSNEVDELIVAGSTSMANEEDILKSSRLVNQSDSGVSVHSNVIEYAVGATHSMLLENVENSENTAFVKLSVEKLKNDSVDKITEYLLFTLLNIEIQNILCKRKEQNALEEIKPRRKVKYLFGQYVVDHLFDLIVKDSFDTMLRLSKRGNNIGIKNFHHEEIESGNALSSNNVVKRTFQHESCVTQRVNEILTEVNEKKSLSPKTRPHDMFVISFNDAVASPALADSSSLAMRPLSPISNESAEVNKEMELNFDDREDEWLDDDFGLGDASSQLRRYQVYPYQDFVYIREIPNKPPPPYTPPGHALASTSPALSSENVNASTNKVNLNSNISETSGVIDYDKGLILDFLETACTFVCTKIQSGEHELNSDEISNYFYVEDMEMGALNASRQIFKDFLLNAVHEIANIIYQTYERPLKSYGFNKKGLGNHQMNDLVLQIKNRIQELYSPTTNKERLKWDRKKRDFVDEILLQELSMEENEWTTYDEDATEVKVQLTVYIFNMLIGDTMNAVKKRWNNCVSENLEK